MIQIQKKPAKHLITAYNQMMEEMRNAFQQARIRNNSSNNNSNGHSDMTLQKALDQSRQQVVHQGEITTAEAHEIGEYIKRDINDAAEYMMETSAEFYDWLMLDIEIIERKVIDLFLSVANHTRIELEQFKNTRPAIEHTPVYKSGEITGPGKLICENCGEIKIFIHSSNISNCEKCQHHRFIRRYQKGNNT